METKNQVGIWMDHLSAHFIDANHSENNHSIESKFDFNTREEALSKSEKLMHNKENQMNDLYFKKIADAILEYDHVLLFGPTNAKNELHNFLNRDLHFKNIKIDVENADKMSAHEKDAFVQHHFKKSKSPLI